MVGQLLQRSSPAIILATNTNAKQLLLHAVVRPAALKFGEMGPDEVVELAGVVGRGVEAVVGVAEPPLLSVPGVEIAV